MIAMLRGRIVGRDEQSVVLETGGVGYEVFVPDPLALGHEAAGEDTVLHVVTQVREDAITLYGLASREERALFQLLVSVSGIGPRLALAALSTWSAEELRAALMNEDEKALCAISGIGKRTAQRMILELREKVSLLGSGAEAPGMTRAPGPAPTGVWSDLHAALANLGFPPRRIEEVVERLRAETPADDAETLQPLLLQALRMIRS